MKIEFFIAGTPRPAGSKKAFLNKKTGRVIVMDQSDNKEWRNSVTRAAWLQMASLGQQELWRGAVAIAVMFYRQRPKAHYNSSGGLKTQFSNFSVQPIMAPDTTKLLRCVEDAMNGVVYADDSQVIYQIAGKQYWSTPGARISVAQLNLPEDLRIFTDDFFSARFMHPSSYPLPDEQLYLKS